MPGLDSAIAALLASRADMLLSALRPQGGSTSGAAAQAGTSQLLVDTPAFAVPTPASAPNTLPPASAQTALSNVARTLDAISRFGGQETPPMSGDTPLWPTAPRPALAASAFATLSGSLFSTPETSAYINAPSTAQTTAVNAPPPVLPAAALASVLAKTVSESGLFYESHIAQWLAGQRSLASLNNEPQAHADKLTAGLPFDAPQSQPQPDAPTDVWIDETLLPPTFSADTPGAVNTVRLVPMPLTPGQAAALAASVRAVPPHVFSPRGSASAAGSASDASDTDLHDAAVQASINAGIHPSTIALVRQQLDLLATGQFRWSGEAWPGAKVDWEIQPRERGAHGRDAIHDNAASLPSGGERGWYTRVTLTLPTLGSVDANLMLTGQHLVVRLDASADGALLLARDGAHFQQQLEAAGLQLASLTVRAMDSLAESVAESVVNSPEIGAESST
ncbi:flagellar hook-length control protein FliK [Caballeronia sp. DA-9]|uniref:flagellar hook-length control protein FliK n=1 Tax=Caballeronia sp. DA-9 TaxID=3436237 RepID=UPI003F67F63A